MSSDAAERVLDDPTLLRRTKTLYSDSRSELVHADGTDEELLARTQVSDGKALAELFTRYTDLAFGISFRILRDRAEAEDLAQEIFLRLFGTNQSFDSAKGSARTWIIQFIYRRALNRRVYLDRRHFYDDTDLADATDAKQEGPLITVEDEMVAQVTANRLIAAFEELTGPQRNAIKMHIFEGASLREISEETGERMENTRHHYYRGLDRLRRIAQAGVGWAEELRPKGE